MPMTLCEKILAAHTDKDSVRPGEQIEARVDFVFTNDVMAPLVIDAFNEIGTDHVFDSKRVGLLPDHFTPAKDIASAENAKVMREFAADQEIEHYYEIGRVGIEHAFLPEQGLVLPGEILVGSDSHTCTAGALGAFATGVGSTDLAAAMATGRIWFKVPASMKFVFRGNPSPWVSGKDIILYTIGKIGVDGARYRAMEFSGEAIEKLDMAGRFSMCNMAIEAGAKAGLIAPDPVTENYLQGRNRRGYKNFFSDPDAIYEKVYEWDISGLAPMVALPHLPSNVKPVTDLDPIAIDQVVIGSCTNGRIEDLRVAARLLEGRTIARSVRCIILPATPLIYQQALEEGLIETFIKAQAAVSTPTCGPCLGGHMGILAAGERVLATTNRNFVGRMGHPQSEVYLSNPAVAAASAVTGRISHPDNL